MAAASSESQISILIKNPVNLGIRYAGKLIKPAVSTTHYLRSARPLPADWLEHLKSDLDAFYRSNEEDGIDRLSPDEMLTHFCRHMSATPIIKNPLLAALEEIYRYNADDAVPNEEKQFVFHGFYNDSIIHCSQGFLTTVQNAALFTLNQLQNMAGIIDTAKRTAVKEVAIRVGAHLSQGIHFESHLNRIAVDQIGVTLPISDDAFRASMGGMTITDEQITRWLKAKFGPWLYNPLGVALRVLREIQSAARSKYAYRGALHSNLLEDGGGYTFATYRNIAFFVQQCCVSEAMSLEGIGAGDIITRAVNKQNLIIVVEDSDCKPVLSDLNWSVVLRAIVNALIANGYFEVDAAQIKVQLFSSTMPSSMEQAANLIYDIFYSCFHTDGFNINTLHKSQRATLREKLGRALKYRNAMKVFLELMIIECTSEDNAIIIFPFFKAMQRLRLTCIQILISCAKFPELFGNNQFFFRYLLAQVKSANLPMLLNVYLEEEKTSKFFVEWAVGITDVAVQKTILAATRRSRTNRKQGWNVLMAAARYCPSLVPKLLEWINDFDTETQRKILMSIAPDDFNVLMLVIAHAPDSINALLRLISGLDNLAQVKILTLKNVYGETAATMLVKYAPELFLKLLEVIDKLGEKDQEAILMTTTASIRNVLMLAVTHVPALFPEVLIRISSFDTEFQKKLLTHTDSADWNILAMVIKNVPECVPDLLKVIDKFEIEVKQTILMYPNYGDCSILMLAAKYAPASIPQLLNWVSTFDADIKKAILTNINWDHQNILTVIINHAPDAVDQLRELLTASGISIKGGSVASVCRASLGFASEDAAVEAGAASG